jgi:hypothetical protein
MQKLTPIALKRLISICGINTCQVSREYSVCFLPDETILKFSFSFVDTINKENNVPDPFGKEVKAKVL